MADLDLTFTTGYNGDVKILYGVDEVVNRLKHYLLTPRGSIPFNPNFGSPISLFSVNNLADSDVESIIEEAIAEWFPEVTLKGVKVTSEKHKATISLILSIGGEIRNVTL